MTKCNIIHTYVPVTITQKMYRTPLHMMYRPFPVPGTGQELVTTCTGEILDYKVVYYKTAMYRDIGQALDAFYITLFLALKKVKTQLVGTLVSNCT